METMNDQLVGMNGDMIIILRAKNRMTREEALRHAAWLVALAEDIEHKFEPVLAAVRNT